MYISVPPKKNFKVQGKTVQGKSVSRPKFDEYNIKNVILASYHKLIFIRLDNFVCVDFFNFFFANLGLFLSHIHFSQSRLKFII